MTISKLVYSKPPADMRQSELIAETAAWLRRNEEERLWTVHAGFLRAGGSVDLWQKSLLRYFNEASNASK